MPVNFRENHEFLSNFFPAKVRWDKGIQSYTVENAYQSAKATNATDRRKIAEASTPNLAKWFGRNLQSIRPDWQSIKIQVMDYLLHQKFAPGSELARKLIETGNDHLAEENIWGDRFWGTVDGKGENNLGKLLMKIRDEFKK